MASGSNKISHRRIKRIFITNYDTGKAEGQSIKICKPEFKSIIMFIIEILDLSQKLVQELITRKCCIFLVFTDTEKIASIQQIYGKKIKKSGKEGLIIPILLDFSNKDDVEKCIKNLPLIDYVVNIFENVEHKSRSVISKQLSKNKGYRTIELNFQRTTALDINEKIFKSNEFTIINCVNETQTGISAVQEFFESTGNDLKPITTHLSNETRNSMRKLFPGKKQKSLSTEEGDEKTSESKHKRSATLPLSFGKRRNPKKTDVTPNIESEPKSRLGPLRRTLSLIRRKKKEPTIKDSSQKSSVLEEIHNRIWEKENKKLSKELHKLHSSLNKSYESRKKKLNTTKINHQKKVAKEIETKMQREKNFLMNKNAEMNSATLSRSSALSPETANRIVASRETRIDREVGRSANKKKVDEFEKLDIYYKEQVEKLKAKQMKETIKSQLNYLDRNTKKFRNKLIEAEEKYWDLVNN